MFKNILFYALVCSSAFSSPLDSSKPKNENGAQALNRLPELSERESNDLRYAFAEKISKDPNLKEEIDSYSDHFMETFLLFMHRLFSTLFLERFTNLTVGIKGPDERERFMSVLCWFLSYGYSWFTYNGLAHVRERVVSELESLSMEKLDLAPGQATQSIEKIADTYLISYEHGILWWNTFFCRIRDVVSVLRLLNYYYR